MVLLTKTLHCYLPFHFNLHSWKPPPPLNKGSGGGGGVGPSKNLVTRRGGYEIFLLERGGKPEKGGGLM